MMKISMAIFLCLLLTGCVTMRYQDGTKSVEYTSVGRTAQSIKGDLNSGTVEVKGQKIDAKVLTAITEFLKAVQ
jgi:PBP1b-binding outer membrane lipoprotein LpoB